MCAAPSQTLLLAPDSRNTVLAELASFSQSLLAYTVYGGLDGQHRQGVRSGFNGQPREASTDWYHLGNGKRVYNPALMRFHSPDRLSPFGKGGLNAYAYCGGDPVNAVDPTGEFFYNAAIAMDLQKSMTIGVSTTFLASALLGPKLHGLQAVGTLIGFTGVPIAWAGVGLQLAEHPAGLYVSNVGTALTLTGSALRLGALTRNARNGIGVINKVKDTIDHYWSGRAFRAPPPAAPTQVNPTEMEIPMTQLERLAAVAGQRSLRRAGAIRRRKRLQPTDQPTDRVPGDIAVEHSSPKAQALDIRGHPTRDRR